MCRRVRQGYCQGLNPRPFRSLDGSCNNIANPTWGMSQTALNRLLPPRYADGLHSFPMSVSGAPLPNARLLSRTFFPDRDYENQEWTLVAMLWGQMASHDLALVPMVQIEQETGPSGGKEKETGPSGGKENKTGPSGGKEQETEPSGGKEQGTGLSGGKEQETGPSGGKEQETGPRTEGIQCCSDDGESILPAQLLHPACMPIYICREDRFYSAFSQHCMNFVRSMTTVGQDCKLSSAEQLNEVTSYLDLSPVYGSSKSTSDSLRTLYGGRLKASRYKGQQHLPSVQNKTSRCDVRNSSEACYSAGDIRVNQNPQLTVLHTILLREHNRVARVLCKLNPHWDDERVYQEARRIVIAEYQHITYYEWLSIFLASGMSVVSMTSKSQVDSLNSSKTNLSAGIFYCGNTGKVQMRAEDIVIKVGGGGGDYLEVTTRGLI
uniref:Peroxidase n=1 Tax=Timema tahoe TaxID=61484 RepID=A0A7R9P137_9NEOP|nr:unnamed protein product [Timema tahoe]